MIPGARMKAGIEHRVPLSSAALRILEELHEARVNDLVFHSRGAALTGNALLMLLRRMKVGYTVHGYRSSFRDWCGEVTNAPREIAEAALAHVVGGQTERAYRRGDALEKRRVLMQDWAAYLAGQSVKERLLVHETEKARR